MGQLTLTQIEKYKPDAQLILKKSDEIYDKCVKGAKEGASTSAKEGAKTKSAIPKKKQNLLVLNFRPVYVWW